MRERLKANSRLQMCLAWAGQDVIILFRERTMSVNEIEPVSVEEFISFLEHKCADSKCPACGNDTFTILSSNEAGPWRFESDVENEAGYHLPTFAVFCRNCGSVRHHTSTIVTKWVHQQRLAPQGVEESSSATIEGLQDE